MDLLEHEGKALFAAAGLPVLPSFVAATPEEARRAAERLGPHVCVKAQAKTGGRGKAGGIRVCGSAGEVETAAADILAMTIRGHKVESVLVERAVDIARELYIGITVSREVRSPLLIFAREGGVDIEELAKRDPRRDPAPPHRPAARAARVPGARRGGRGAVRPGPAGRDGRGRRARRGLPGAVEAVPRPRRDAGRGQPTGAHGRRRARLPRQQGDDRRQRAVPAPGDGAGAAGGRSARPRPARRASRSSRSAATSASSATAPASS